MPALGAGFVFLALELGSRAKKFVFFDFCFLLPHGGGGAAAAATGPRDLEAIEAVEEQIYACNGWRNLGLL